MRQKREEERMMVVAVVGGAEKGSSSFINGLLLLKKRVGALWGWEEFVPFHQLCFVWRHGYLRPVHNGIDEAIRVIEISFIGLTDLAHVVAVFSVYRAQERRTLHFVQRANQSCGQCQLQSTFYHWSIIA